MPQDSDGVASIKSQAGRWLFGQEANTVMAVLLFAVACWYGWYQITVVEPRKEKAQQEAEAIHASTYERIAVVNADAIKAGMEHGEKAADKRVKELLDAMEKKQQAGGRRIDPAATAKIGPGANGESQ